MTTKTISKFLVCACRQSDGTAPWSRVVRAEIVKAPDLEAAKIKILRERLVVQVFDLSDARQIAALLIAGDAMLSEPDETAIKTEAETRWEHIARMSAQGHTSGSFVASPEGMVNK